MNKSSKLRNILGFLLVFGPACFLIFISTRGCKHQFESLDDYGIVPAFTFVDGAGHSRSSKEFEGEVLLITTLQNRCPYDCSVAFWKIDKILYQHIRTNSYKQLKRVRIISFVTDGKGNPVKDISTIQQTLASEVEGFDPKLWIVAKGDARSVFDIQHNGQTLLQKGPNYYGGEAFQELMLLVDKQRHLRMVLKGNQEGLIRTMKESLALLLKQYDKHRVKGH